MRKSNRSTPKNLHLAGSLRHQQTPAETRLWAHLRSHRVDGIHFRRQHAIGDYIVDFCSPAQKLVIEVDGSQHLDLEKADAKRTAYLESRGYRVIRFWDGQVLSSIEEVMSVIIDELNKPG